MDKIPIIYIAGTGRCGSTILNMLLGSHPRVFTIGDFFMLPWELKLDNKCTCGETLPQCDFWGTLIQNNLSLIQNVDIHKFREAPGSGAVVRKKYLRAIYTGDDHQLDPDEVATYGKQNFKLLESVFEEAADFKDGNLRYLVDSSKDLYRLLLLQQSDLFDIKVLHLFKEPEAFVYSMVKGRKDFDKLSKTLRFTGRWILENWLIEQVCDNFFRPVDVVKVRYDDFAGKPNSEMKEIFRRLDLDETYSSEIVDRFLSEEHHNISGNKARFENKVIVLDQKWKENLGLLEKKFVKSLTWKQNSRYRKQRLKPKRFS